ncbi:MAG: sugar kinase, partial [Bdellovibrionaceae bacterium]|nr:sugar kinase [Bdellovibrio sp.]
ALPIESVVDPTGAGDSFAGGFFGTLASAGPKVPTWADLKAATLAGTVMSSQTIQDFSLKALAKVDRSLFDLQLAQLKQMIS